MVASVGRYALGVAALAVVCGSLAVLAVALRRRWLGDWAGAPARLAEAVIGLAVLVAILEVLGTLRLFELGPVVAACVVVSVAAVAFIGPQRVPHRRPGAVVGPAVVIGLLGAATVFAEWGALTIQSYNVGIRGFDSLWYHLPWAASFAQTGNVVSLRFTDVEYLTPFYPATAELLHGLGIVLLGRDTISPGFNLVWLGLVLLAAYCIGRPRGVGWATLLGAAVAMATTMMDYSQAGSAANDVVAVFFLLAAVALLMNGLDARAPLVLAGVAAGLAVGVKLTVLAPVAALTVGVVAIAPRGRRLSVAGLWFGPLLLAGGFWYARNLVVVGNPLPWTSVGILPTPEPALQQHTGFAIAHYVFHGGAHLWSRFFEPGLASGLGRWWWAVLAVAVIGPLLCVLSGRLAQNSEIVRVPCQTRMLGLVALASLAAYLVTPETAAGPAGNPLGFAFNLRYLAPALALSLAVAPLAPALSSPVARATVVVGLAVLLAGTVAQPRLWPSEHVAGTIVIAAVAAAVSVVLVALRRRSAPIVLVTAAALIVVGAAGGYRLQRHYLRGRYVYQPGVSSLSPVWAMFRGIHDARVGVVGTFGGFFAYPLFGLDGSNRVQYVGLRGAHGSFTPIDSCARWRAQVNRDRLTYVVTTPGRDPWHPRVLSASPETHWTASDPAAEPVYRERALGQPIVVFRIRGALNPGRCV